ncbi:hypothetical protein WDJ50_17890 (plasmid) [Deinococcus sp. VB142]|uniref:Transposase n=2 Tax=unclassified Deinococcus TaxID=2623546 RepID=A0AAU6Q7V1_9DEIO
MTKLRKMLFALQRRAELAREQATCAELAYLADLTDWTARRLELQRDLNFLKVYGTPSEAGLARERLNFWDKRRPVKVDYAPMPRALRGVVGVLWR